MLNWKAKFNYHMAIAKAYNSLLHDEYRMKHPKRYAYADTRWRYHAKRACSILSEQLERLRLRA